MGDRAKKRVFDRLPDRLSSMKAPISPCSMVQTPISPLLHAGPTSCALGPHVVEKINAKHLCKPSFISATIYHPTLTAGGNTQFPSIVVVGGWACGEQAMAAWGPFYASHGIIAMTIGTPAPFKDMPAQRCMALLDAVRALQAENTSPGSVLQGRLKSSCSVQGWSLGGGGAQLAAMADLSLKCVIALCPHPGPPETPGLPGRLSDSVPVLIIAGQNDNVANTQSFAWPEYHSTSAPSLILEVRGGDHAVANGPSGGTTKEGLGMGPGFMCLVANFVLHNCCSITPCPYGTYNGPVGHARPMAPLGAIGGFALAWLKLFLEGDESARSLLLARPDIASGFEMKGIALRFDKS